MFINDGRIVLLLGDPSAGIPHHILSQTGVQENLCVTLGASPDGGASEPETTESQVQAQGPPDALSEGLKPPLF
jgi:hypothetical protein